MAEFDGPADRAPSGAPARREAFLDVVRAVAIVRVIAWHAFGLAAITYVVAAMPAMFFVSGSLLAQSFGRRRTRTVLVDRFRRLLVPLWAFGLVAWGAMAVAAWRTGTPLPIHRALAWIFPLTDPVGSSWEGGWLSSHLWYLRTVTWLFLLAPLLLRAVRARPRLTILVLVAAVFALDVVDRHGTTLPFGHRGLWGAGDVVLYSVFLLMGFLHRDGHLRTVTRRGWVAVALVAAVGAAAWRLTQPVPLGVVNNSHPLHLFVGLAWLAAALAVQQPLARLGATGLVGPAVRAIGKRALTIYLWHTAAIIVALNVLDARGVDGPVAHPVGLVVLTALGVVVAIQLFGWVEDIAARRRPVRPVRAPLPARPPWARHPAPWAARAPGRPLAVLGRPAVALAAVVAMAAVALLAPHVRPDGVPEAAAAVSRSSRRPPIPSKPPPAPTFEGEAAGPAPEALTDQQESKLVARLDGLLQEWAERTGVEGALVGIAGPNLRWRGATGIRPDTGAAVTVTDRIELASLTKLFTAALVHRLADQGRIDLSAPLPEIRALPDFPYEYGITVEQLLDHTSGLVNYLDTALYVADESSIDGPVSGVMASVAEPLNAEPGEQYLYSSTNFLVLGLLLEDVTGRPLSDLFRDTFFGPLGMHDTIHRAPEPAWPRGGTAGIETSLPDLLTAGVGILRDHVGLSDEAYAAMTAVDPSSGFGPGTFGFCPCRLDGNGDPQFFAIGYYGATTLLAYAPSLDLTIAVDLVDSLGHNGGYDAVSTLFAMVEELARSS
jgi:CubicO group peptidase (beta-lactamase class C family)/peptidoglycan/LPS O-acetylase OafA/YrhL